MLLTLTLSVFIITNLFVNLPIYCYPVSIWFTQNQFWWWYGWTWSLCSQCWRWFCYSCFISRFSSSIAGWRLCSCGYLSWGLTRRSDSFLNVSGWRKFVRITHLFCSRNTRVSPLNQWEYVFYFFITKNSLSNQRKTRGKYQTNKA